MKFDLEDLEMWEPVLFGATSKKQLIDAVAKRKAGEAVEETIFKQEVLCSFLFLSFCRLLLGLQWSNPCR